MDALLLNVPLIAYVILFGAVLIAVVRMFRIPGILERIAETLDGIDIEMQEMRIEMEAIRGHTELLSAPQNSTGGGMGYKVYEEKDEDADEKTADEGLKRSLIPTSLIPTPSFMPTEKEIIEEGRRRAAREYESHT